MVKVNIKADSKFPVDRGKIREAVAAVLKKFRVKEQVIVSVSVVGDRKMKGLNKKFRKLDKTTDVLSFPTHDPTQSMDDEGFLQAPELGLHLGDLVVSFPQAIEIASKKNKLVDDVVYDLVEHGMYHLMGIHHD